MICGAFTEIQASSDSDRSSDEWDVRAREAQTWIYNSSANQRIKSGYSSYIRKTNKPTSKQRFGLTSLANKHFSL